MVCQHDVILVRELDREALLANVNREINSGRADRSSVWQWLTESLYYRKWATTIENFYAPAKIRAPVEWPEHH